ncbi:hypothetical protein LJC49_01565 [Ruminococcaceae bacterium OttesenSCG-928-I18]|nr:hypothetical protein [Ruminococcaceae bacterium OttesenSCG-928-I18]
MSFYGLTMANSSLTKKARKITAAQHNGKFGYVLFPYRAGRRVRHDLYARERPTPTARDKLGQLVGYDRMGMTMILPSS